MRGKKPTPIEIHKTTGTYRKDRHEAAINPTDTGAPSASAWLSPAAREAWGEIVPHLVGRKVLTKSDSAALQVLAETFAEWKQLSQDIAIEGMTYKCLTEAGAEMIRANPKVAMRSDAQRRLAGMLSEFGMTAASRSKVSEVSDAKPNNMFAAIGSKA